MAKVAGTFSVNVLAAGQAPLADRFADASRLPGATQFVGLSWTVDELTRAPLIGGCLAHLACRTDESRRIGDHDLIVAQVLAGTPAAGSPLLTFAGALDREPPGAPLPAVSEE